VTGAATLHIDLAKIEANARSMCARLAPDVDVTAVTKVTCGSPEVGRAMLAGGAAALADSRIPNLERLRAAGLDVPLWLLRAPTPALAAEAVAVADISLNSELETVRALDAAADATGRRHGIVLMIDLGDLREGIMPRELDGFLDTVLELKHLDLVGVGTNLTCYGAIIPTPDNLGRLVKLAAHAAMRADRPLLVSGGNSSSLDLAFDQGLPAGVTNLRIGESILLGVSTITRDPLPDLHLDAFVLEAPVVECRVKPSIPTGETAQDAFGRRPLFADRGPRLRAICALGRQDCVPEGLRPLDAGVEILGASSDHLILDVEAMEERPRVGDRLRFVPGYGGLLLASTSPYVHKVFHPPA
jgi:ornithine racemase